MPRLKISNIMRPNAACGTGPPSEGFARRCHAISARAARGILSRSPGAKRVRPLSSRYFARLQSISCSAFSLPPSMHLGVVQEGAYRVEVLTEGGVRDGMGQ
eukprot:15240509-Heterocapsa_arctica.AAC.1